MKWNFLAWVLNCTRWWNTVLLKFRLKFRAQLQDDIPKNWLLNSKKKSLWWSLVVFGGLGSLAHVFCFACAVCNPNLGVASLSNNLGSVNSHTTLGFAYATSISYTKLYKAEDIRFQLLCLILCILIQVCDAS